MRRTDPQDPEYQRPAPSLAEQLEGTGLFTEPDPVPLPGHDPIAVRYTTWRTSEDGQVVYAWIERRALTLASAGERRIGSKSLVERARDTLHRHVDNKFSCMIARELLLRYPHLQAHIEIRERKAAA